jgi:hypothetical protein
MNETLCHAGGGISRQRQSKTGAQPDIVPKDKVRAAISSQLTSSAEPQTRVFWD